MTTTNKHAASNDRNATASENLGRIQRLICCCCGGYTRGRQFHNQDHGYGLGSCCVEFVKARVQDMAGTYGIAGVHYLLPDPPAPKPPVLPEAFWSAREHRISL